MIFCGIINKEIQVPVCPLKTGTCLWKHRKTAMCCYTTDKLTKDKYCELVGIDNVPDNEEIAHRRQALQNLLIKEKYQ